jgi:glycosyltransferase involved in cell wall biosynthesis
MFLFKGSVHMISVCMATYNGSLYIKEQIQSILEQLSDSDELIISDDGSIDGTLDIVESYEDHRIILVNGKGQGLIRNFENALTHANGDNIFLTDQDDIWLKGKVFLCNELLKSQKVSLVVTDCKVVDSSLNILSPSFFQLRQSGGGFLSNLAKNSYLGCCMAFKREVLERSLPFPERIPMHDWWLGLNSALTGKVVFLEQPLILYRRHGGNASSTAEISKYNAFEKITHRILLSFYLFKRFLIRKQNISLGKNPVA